MAKNATVSPQTQKNGYDQRCVRGAEKGVAERPHPPVNREPRGSEAAGFWRFGRYFKGLRSGEAKGASQLHFRDLPAALIETL
jgi:hypothetical protein